MAVAAKDGSMHHSAGRASLHDQMSAEGGKPKSMSKPATSGGKVFEKPSAHSIEDHVAEHGPAVEMHHHHDEEADVHHVTTHHGEGGKEKHHSEHKTHEEVHEHIGKALGVGAGEEDQAAQAAASPDSAIEDQNERGGGGGIPGVM